MVLVIAISLLQFSGVVLYLRNTILGRTKPNRVTFFLWATVPFIALLAGFTEGESWSLVPVFMAAFGPALIFFASFFNPHAYWKLGLFDYLCGILALAAIGFWITSDVPAVAVFFAVVADGLASIPTLLKSWQHPETETGIGYTFAAISGIAGLLALKTFGFSEAAFLVYTFVLNFLLVIGIYRRNPVQKIQSEFAR